MPDQELNEKRIKLAREILILARNTLLVNLRFLDIALNQFELIPIQTNSLLTDGKNIFYNPMHILSNYKIQKETSVRDYLHIVLHCIFRHMYMEPNLNRVHWDLACDIAVENIISELGIKSVVSARQKMQEQYLDAIRTELKLVTAEKIYAFLEGQNVSDSKAAEIRGLFYADNHEIWYMTAAAIQELLGLDPFFYGENGISHSDTSQSWKNISEKIQMDLETFSRQQGDKAGNLLQNLNEVNREKYDYTAFLKKFAALGEVMQISDAEFDYVFYTYGLKLYEKMPLIEPLEYKEVKRIREFVIAIDTSGSTSGELVQKFVQKTFNILKSSESFFSKINLHILQCDTQIQEHIKITSQEEFDSYLKNMKIRGLGGTDFRPVFQTVDELIRKKEFLNLKGLVYFTDGYGTFPARKPDYDTAFVFIDDENNNYNVPPWAIKLVLRKDEIQEMST